MLRELRSHAAYSEMLREAALKKSAGLVGVLLKPVVKAGKWALRHPYKSTVIGGGLGLAYHNAKASQPQLHPAVIRAQLGINPAGLPEQ